ncbi:hypothetical protein [Synechocystis sp. LKSZ1]|uniref:hypothetical protein n=1 Tax=Synechocystis sp. LKSZ1 TaxID=3144951 RepID=UPI00336C2C3D
MRLPKAFPASLFLLLSLTAVADVASAVPTAGKETRTGDIYVSGLNSYQTLEAAYPGLPKIVKKTANECGFFKLASTESSPITDASNLQLGSNTAFTVGSLPTQAAPKCTDGQLAGTNLTPAAVLKTAEGDVYFTGLVDYSQHDVRYLDLSQTRSIKANTCGIAKLSSTGAYANPTGVLTLKDKETQATVIGIDTATIASVSGGPICRNGVALFTADWP